MTSLFKTICLSSVMILSTSMTFAETKANSNDENVEISTQTKTTREELAAIQVLSEICPQIIGKNKNFDAGYQRMLVDFLPGISNPSLAVKALSDDVQYQAILDQARQDASRASREDNREVCLGVIDWNNKK